MKIPAPYTLEELFENLPAVRDELQQRLEVAQQEHPTARPMPPMLVDEALEALTRIMGIALERPLTTDEVFMHGQLLAVLRMAVTTQVLGYQGRYLVLSEDDLKRRIMR